MTPLHGSRVLITGASSGIGAHTARLLAERGASVALVARGRLGLERVAAAVAEHGGRAVVAPADVTDAAELTRVIDRAAEELGGLDVVIVNAGAAAYGPLRDMSGQDVRRTIEVTLVGAANTALAALPHLERSGGRLVVTGSVAALQPQPLMAAYAAAKHGLRGLMESLRLELRAAGSPVRVSLVHPGPVDTPFWQHVTAAGATPPVPPAAYRPQEVARALVDAATGGPPERTLGLAMRASSVLRVVCRPLSDVGLIAVARWALAHQSDAAPDDGLHRPTGADDLDGGVPHHLGGWRARVAQLVGAA